MRMAGKPKWMNLLLCLLFIVFVSCKQEVGVFEKNTTIPEYNWKKSFPAKGKFIITDTLASYNLYIVLRHLDAYQYNNIWLNVGLKAPGDTMFIQKINITLGSEAKGWEGIGMNDIWEVRKLLNGVPRRFIKNGEYEFQINHIMREDPLYGVTSAGFRIEKVGAR